MALFQIGYASSVLRKQMAFNAVFPDNVIAENKKFPVVYLLHGLSDDHTIWLRRSNIERYAALYGTAVIMPDGDRSFYTDMKHGGAWFKAVSEELPEFVNRMFPVSTERKDTFIAGLSMGGYGTWDLAARRPELFAAALPVCGGGDVARAPRLAKLPLWTVHGDKDGAVPVENSRRMVKAVNAAGGKVIYEELPGRGHGVWGYTYGSDRILDWFFSQRR
jgi:predicted peptidase